MSSTHQDSLPHVPSEVQRRHGEDRQRRNPDAAAPDGLLSREQQERCRQTCESAGEQPQRRLATGPASLRPPRPRAEPRRGRSGRRRPRSPDGSSDGPPWSRGLRAGRARRPPAEIPGRRTRRPRSIGAGRPSPAACATERQQFAEIPDEAAETGEQRQTATTRQERRAFGRPFAPDHRQQHHIEHRTCQKTQQIHGEAGGGGHHGRNSSGPVVASATSDARVVDLGRPMAGGRP